MDLSSGPAAALTPEDVYLRAVAWSGSVEDTARRLRADGSPERVRAVLTAIAERKGAPAMLAVLGAI